MSTRSVIARIHGNGGFEGRYHHWDGYPEALGATLYSLANGKFKDRIASMLKVLIDDHPAGWSTINDADWEQPIGYGCKGPQCYCHGERSEKGHSITHKNASGCGCEWAYVFHRDDGKEYMDVLSSRCPDGGKMIGAFGCGDPKATWHKIATVDLSGPEPDWEAMQG